MRQPGDRIDQEANQSADQRPVDPNELQIPAHQQLDASGGLIRIPGAHGLGDELTHLPRCCPLP